MINAAPLPFGCRISSRAPPTLPPLVFLGCTQAFFHPRALAEAARYYVSVGVLVVQVAYRRVPRGPCHLILVTLRGT